MDAEVEVQSFAHAMLTYIGKHNLCITANDGVLQTTPSPCRPEALLGFNMAGTSMTGFYNRQLPYTIGYRICDVCSGSSWMQKLKYKVLRMPC